MRIWIIGVAIACTSVWAAVGLATPGELDTSFGEGGTVITDFGGTFDEAHALVLQPDGKLVAAGGGDFALARYMPDGTLDGGFGSDGRVRTPVGGAEVWDLTVLPNGKLVAAGRAGGPGGTDLALARYNPDGTLDPSFGADGVVTTDLDGGNDRAWGLVAQPDGKVVAAGRTTPCTPFCSGPSDFALARYNLDGSLDPSFGEAGIVTLDFGGAADEAFALELLPDGKLVASGYAGFATWAIARFDGSGAPDPSFGNGGMVAVAFPGARQPHGLAVQPDGKLVLSGYASNFPNPSGAALARFNADGSLDAGFGTGGQTMVDGGGEAVAVAVQRDGKLIAAGGQGGDLALFRFLSNGTLDSSFGSAGVVTTDVPGFTDYGAWGLVVQPDGKVVVAGGNYDNGNADFVLARYLGDLTTTRFDSLDARVTMLLPRGDHNDSVWVSSSFTLGRASDGLDIATETVQLDVGTLSLTLAPGSLARGPLGWVYRGNVNGANWTVVLGQRQDRFVLGVTAGRLTLARPDGTVDVTVAIGDDAGTTTVWPRVLPPG